MLTYRSSKPFDTWMDSGMRLAKLYVKVWVNSKHFTLLEYEGKDEFYDLATEAFTKFSGELSSLENKYHYTDKYIESFRRTLDWCIKLSTLSL